MGQMANNTDGFERFGGIYPLWAPDWKIESFFTQTMLSKHTDLHPKCILLISKFDFRKILQKGLDGVLKTFSFTYKRAERATLENGHVLASLNSAEIECLVRSTFVN